LAWDSEFFGARVASVELDPDGDAGGLEAVAQGHDVAYLLCALEHVDAIHEAESHGFRLVDLRCVVELAAPVEIPIPSGVEVRVVTPAELGRVADMAAELHDNTRFANDPGIRRERVAELYRRYVRRDAASADWSVRVAVRNGEIIGYATHGPRDRTGGETGTIGLIGVSPSARGLGLGAALVAEVVRCEAVSGRSRMSVVTQGGSRPALAMYQRAGFVVERIDAWLHWHRQRREG